MTQFLRSKGFRIMKLRLSSESPLLGFHAIREFKAELGHPFVETMPLSKRLSQDQLGTHGKHKGTHTLQTIKKPLCARPMWLRSAHDCASSGAENLEGSVSYVPTSDFGAANYQSTGITSRRTETTGVTSAVLVFPPLSGNLTRQSLPLADRWPAETRVNVSLHTKLSEAATKLVKMSMAKVAAASVLLAAQTRPSNTHTRINPGTTFYGLGLQFTNTVVPKHEIVTKSKCNESMNQLKKTLSLFPHRKTMGGKLSRKIDKVRALAGKKASYKVNGLGQPLASKATPQIADFDDIADTINATTTFQKRAEDELWWSWYKERKSPRIEIIWSVATICHDISFFHERNDASTEFASIDFLALLSNSPVDRKTDEELYFESPYLRCISKDSSCDYRSDPGFLQVKFADIDFAAMADSALAECGGSAAPTGQQYAERAELESAKLRGAANGLHKAGAKLAAPETEDWDIPGAILAYLAYAAPDTAPTTPTAGCKNFMGHVATPEKKAKSKALTLLPPCSLGLELLAKSASSNIVSPDLVAMPGDKLVATPSRKLAALDSVQHLAILPRSFPESFKTVSTLLMLTQFGKSGGLASISKLADAEKVSIIERETRAMACLAEDEMLIISDKAYSEVFTQPKIRDNFGDADDNAMIEALFPTNHSAEPQVARLDLHELAEACREKLYKANDYWTRTKLMLLELQEKEDLPARSKPKLVSFADNEAENASTDLESSEPSDTDFSSPLNSGSISGLESEIARVSDTNHGADTESSALILKNYRRVFTHLVKNVVLPCNRVFAGLIKDILSIRNTESELYCLTVGIGTMVSVLIEHLKGKEQILPSQWQTRLASCRSTLADLAQTREVTRIDLDRLEAGFCSRLKESLESITKICILRCRLLKNYNLFCSKKYAEQRSGAQNVHDYTHASKYKESTLWHYEVDITELWELMHIVTRALRTDHDSVGALITLTRAGLTSAQTALDLYVQVQPNAICKFVAATPKNNPDNLPRDDAIAEPPPSDSPERSFKKRRTKAKQAKTFGELKLNNVHH
ncbi:hypothetical protein METSCH_C04230 [Metschnikowia aff. pulcherrima]|uniref:Uncharacterized protein n=1 Tax=Metschnikowia aff. pulcherrima TaxID=2163413 RepID=A0A4P6XP78_9ASCO|nr:hypothetical protein METSCH_C04230 [Metschnikowia aff. pulcherrima]